MGLAAERSYTVYMHTSPSGKKYIGITCQDVARRWERGGTGYGECPYFWNAICRHGWDNFQHEIIAEGLIEAEAKRREKELIIFYKTQDSMYGYNLTAGGDGLCGYHHSEEACKKMSAAGMGNQNCIGIKHTIEARANMSAAQMGNRKALGNKNALGYKHTVEARAKMSEAGKGKPKTAEHRANISAAAMGNQSNLGNKRTDATRAKMSEAMIGKNKGKIATPETRAKMSAAHLGRNKQTDLKIG